MATTEAQKRANQKQQEKRRQADLVWIMERLGKVKICSKCGYEGDITNFRQDYTIDYDRPTKSQIKGTCKKCRNEYQNEKNSNPEVKKARAKKVWETIKSNPELLERKKERDKIYYSKPETKRKRCEDVKQSRKDNPIIYRWRKLLWNAYKQVGKVKPNNTNTIELLVYTSTDLDNRLGVKPTKTAQIDHLIPLNWFILDTPPSISCDLRNLEWKTQSENASKSNRYADPVCREYYDLVINYIRDEYKSQIKVI
jgi:hypothetical protein